MHLQSSKEKFNCRDRLGGCLELIQSPHLSFFSQLQRALIHLDCLVTVCLMEKNIYNQDCAAENAYYWL